MPYNPNDPSQYTDFSNRTAPLFVVANITISVLFWFLLIFLTALIIRFRYDLMAYRTAVAAQPSMSIDTSHITTAVRNLTVPILLGDLLMLALLAFIPGMQQQQQRLCMQQRTARHCRCGLLRSAAVCCGLLRSAAGSDPNPNRCVVRHTSYAGFARVMQPPMELRLGVANEALHPWASISTYAAYLGFGLQLLWAWFASPFALTEHFPRYCGGCCGLCACDNSCAEVAADTGLCCCCALNPSIVQSARSPANRRASALGNNANANANAGAAPGHNRRASAPAGGAIQPGAGGPPLALETDASTAVRVGSVRVAPSPAADAVITMPPAVTPVVAF
jgi:hypothetical protein